jgi:agmatine deiminase
MIQDSQTDKVYFSKWLKTDDRFAPSCKLITSILDRHEIKYDFLEETSDIWARDYMPVQKDVNSFVQFRYEPSYLVYEPYYQSDPKEVCRANNIKPIFSEINLDGGNIVKQHDKVIISKRIFSENPGYDPKKLVKDIENLLEARVILVPDISRAYDLTGHADGYLRFVDENTILVNELENELKYWKKGFLKMIKETGLKYIEIPWLADYDEDFPKSALGIYINYLEVGNLIIMPVFEIEGNKDEEVFSLFKSIFPQKIIETVNINTIGREGGLMNCISWNIKS